MGLSIGFIHLNELCALCTNLEREICMFYDNLKRICDEKNIKMTPLVAACGGAKGSISNWKNGASPNSDIVAKLAVHLNVSTDLLIFGNETQYDSDKKELLNNYDSLPSDFKLMVKERIITLSELAAAKKQAVKTPLKQDKTAVLKLNTEYIELDYPELAASAGYGEELHSDNVKKLRVPLTNLTGRADFAIKVHGDSMEPMYHDGDIVLIDSDAEVRSGDVGIFVLNGEGYIKKWGNDRLISLNNKYKDIKICGNDRCECKGKVIGVL